MIGTPASSGMTSALTAPKVERDGWIVASIDRIDVEQRGHRLATSAGSLRSINIVRDAFDGSVTKAPPSTPPVKPPHQPGVDRGETRCAQVVHGAVVEEPAHLGGREVRRRARVRSSSEPAASRRARRARWQYAAVRRSCQTMARWGSRPVVAVEGDRCLSLVGDAERDDVVALRARARGDVAQRGDSEIGDLAGVVFDLAGAGEVLGEFAVGGVPDLDAGVEGDAAHPRGAGVEGENQFHRGHASEGYRVGFRVDHWVKNNCLKNDQN